MAEDSGSFGEDASFSGCGGWAVVLVNFVAVGRSCEVLGGARFPRPRGAGALRPPRCGNWG